MIGSEMKSEKDSLIEYPANKAHRLHNINCVYCRNTLDKASLTKEHVIGRKFVPKGMLDGQWNMIANACMACNSHKSDLEDDISAITMQPDATGRHVSNDEILSQEAIRKGKGAFSQMTGKAVRDSHQTITLTAEQPGFKMSFGLIAPPQIGSERVARLAYYHVTGFFFMQTYKEETKIGGCPFGVFCPVIEADRADWGNDVMVWFMRETKDWDIRLHAITAQEYFKIEFRKTDNDLLAWAVEWNQKKRCVGFWGQEADIEAILKKKPVMKRQHISGDTQNGLFARMEKALDPNEDILFVNPQAITA
jgi:hypothetical protein